jgi:hypothetical protein
MSAPISMARLAAASRRATPPERPRQSQDAKAGSKALLGVGPLLEDEIAERCSSGADEHGVPAKAADGPVGITAVPGRHVIGDSGVLAVATRAHVHGDPLALDEDLRGAAVSHRPRCP